MSVILTAYYRPKPGGFCKRLFRAMEALLAQGHEVHYLSLEPFPISHPHCHWHRFPWPFNKSEGLLFWGCLHLLAPVILLAIGIKYRATHTFAFGANYGFFLQALRLLRGLPLAVFLRGDAMEKHRLSRQSKWLITVDHFVEGLGIWGADVFGVSQSLTENIKQRHPYMRPNSAHTLRNNLEAAPPLCKPADNATGSIRIGCVGVLEKTKNQRFLVELVATMAETKLHVSLYGEGPAKPQLEALVQQLQLENRVSFEGWVEPQDIWPNVDLLIMPSLYEGSPNAVLEALSESIPVLVSDIPAHREILPADHLLPLDQSARWQACLSTIAANPGQQLHVLCETQRPCAEELHFNWAQAVSDAILRDVSQ